MWARKGHPDGWSTAAVWERAQSCCELLCLWAVMHSLMTGTPPKEIAEVGLALGLFTIRPGRFTINDLLVFRGPVL